MNFKTILKVISAIVAIAGVAVAVYLAIQKLTAPKEAEYFDDSDFFECDNDLEIVETAAADTQVQEKAEPAEKKAPAACWTPLWIRGSPSLMLSACRRAAAMLCLTSANAGVVNTIFPSSTAATNAL